MDHVKGIHIHTCMDTYMMCVYHTWQQCDIWRPQINLCNKPWTTNRIYLADNCSVQQSLKMSRNFYKYSSTFVLFVCRWLLVELVTQRFVCRKLQVEKCSRNYLSVHRPILLYVDKLLAGWNVTQRSWFVCRWLLVEHVMKLCFVCRQHLRVEKVTAVTQLVVWECKY